MSTPPLSERDQRVLAFERQWWKFPGAKEAAIRAQFDLSPTRYYQMLQRLIDDPGAEVHDPMLIKRLRRIRDERKQHRARPSYGATGTHR